MSLQHRGDSTHFIIGDAKLLHGGELHRFNNPCGVPYSAIYRDDFEYFSCEREKEQEMIDYWNEKDPI